MERAGRHTPTSWSTTGRLIEAGNQRAAHKQSAGGSDDTEKVLWPSSERAYAENPATEPARLGSSSKRRRCRATKDVVFLACGSDRRHVRGAGTLLQGGTPAAPHGVFERTGAQAKRALRCCPARKAGRVGGCRGADGRSCGKLRQSKPERSRGNPARETDTAYTLMRDLGPRVRAVLSPIR